MGVLSVKVKVVGVFMDVNGFVFAKLPNVCLQCVIAGCYNAQSCIVSVEAKAPTRQKLNNSANRKVLS